MQKHVFELRSVCQSFSAYYADWGGGQDETLLAHASWTLSSFKRILFPTHAKDKTGQDLVLARGTHRTIIARGAFGVSFRTHAFPDAGAVRSRRLKCLCVCMCVCVCV